MSTPHNREKNKNLTFIKIMIVIGMISLTSLGVYIVQAGYTQEFSFSKELETATKIAQSSIETIKNAAYRDITQNNYAHEPGTTIADHERFHRHITIQDDTPEPDTKTIMVTVSWQDDIGATHHIALSTIITP